MAIKLTSTLLGLKCFYIMVAIVVGLVWNVFWIFVFLGQSGAWCSKLKYITHGYFKGTLIGLISWVVTLATNSTTLMCTTCITCSSLFLLWHISLAWPIFPHFEHVNGWLVIV